MYLKVWVQERVVDLPELRSTRFVLNRLLDSGVLDPDFQKALRQSTHVLAAVEDAYRTETL